MSLNTIEEADILAIIKGQTDRISKIERILQGEPIGTVRIANAAITDAKIASVGADKITTGTLAVLVSITIRNEDDTADQGLIGYQAGGF